MAVSTEISEFSTSGNRLRAAHYELMYSTSAKYIVMQKTGFFFCVWQIPDVPEDVIW